MRHRMESRFAKLVGVGRSGQPWVFFKQKTAYEIVDCDWSSDVWLFRSYEKLNRQRQNEKDLAQKAAQDAYNAQIADFETGYENCKKQFESWTVTDVKQKQGDLFAEHTFVLHGKEFSFVERDLHDLGFVINPMYRIDPDSTASGYLTCDDTGAKVWCVNGSRYIPLSEDETLCVNAICQYGKFVNSSIRM